MRNDDVRLFKNRYLKTIKFQLAIVFIIGFVFLSIITYITIPDMGFLYFWWGFFGIVIFIITLILYYSWDLLIPKEAIISNENIRFKYKRKTIQINWNDINSVQIVKIFFKNAGIIKYGISESLSLPYLDDETLYEIERRYKIIIREREIIKGV